MNSCILSIVVPTVKYSSYFDETINSCLNLKLPYKFEIVVSVNNKDFSDFKNSIYFKNDKIIWKCLRKNTIPMADSINQAIEYSKGEWIFVLSDDDLILEDFLAEIDLLTLSKQSLYATRINIIDDKGNVIRENKQYTKKVYSTQEAVELFMKNQIHNHISLLVFHTSLLKRIGKFKLMGYPNGYYIDTVFHGKALANCDYLYTADKIVFSRRESSTQGSAKFYFDKEVNDYFNVIVDTLFEDANFKIEALKRYGTKKAFYKRMIENRFYTEWSKLNKSIYNKSFKKELEFLYKHMIYWNTGIVFKFHSIFYVFKYELIKHLPQSVKNRLKKLLGR